MGIAYSVVGDHEGTRAKIENAYKVKEHFEVHYQIIYCMEELFSA